MNTCTNSTAPAPAPDHEKLYDALEGPIGLVLRRARAASYIVGHLLDAREGDCGQLSVSRAMADALGTLCFDVEDAAKALDDLWTVGFSASVAAEASQ